MRWITELAVYSSTHERHVKMPFRRVLPPKRHVRARVNVSLLWIDALRWIIRVRTNHVKTLNAKRSEKRNVKRVKCLKTVHFTGESCPCDFLYIYHITKKNHRCLKQDKWHFMKLYNNEWTNCYICSTGAFQYICNVVPEDLEWKYIHGVITVQADITMMNIQYPCICLQQQDKAWVIWWGKSNCFSRILCSASYRSALHSQKRHLDETQWGKNKTLSPNNYY